MSSYVPSPSFRLGMATNSPEFPLMTFRSRITKQPSKTSVAKAFNLSSGFRNGNTLTSVISMPSLRCHRFLPGAMEQLRAGDPRTGQQKETRNYFFLWRLARRFFLRLCVAIFIRFRFFPDGI